MSRAQVCRALGHRPELSFGRIPFPTAFEMHGDAEERDGDDGHDRGESVLETERLAAMIDGLALRASLHPDQLPPALARSVVRRHLRKLSKG